MSTKLRQICIVLGIAGVMVALALAGAAYLVYPGLDPLPFEAQAWQQADPETRGRMVGQLPESRIMGKSAEQVREVLGPEDFAFDGLGENPSHHLTYDVGHQGFRPGLPFAFTWRLHVVFKQDVAIDWYLDD